MKNELAKKIKNSGFPNIKSGEHFDHRLGSHRGDYGGDSDYPCHCNEDKFPTLSELIEACGDRFKALIKRKDGWITTQEYTNEVLTLLMEGYASSGSSPEEAVANLWLKLNEK